MRGVLTIYTKLFKIIHVSAGDPVVHLNYLALRLSVSRHTPDEYNCLKRHCFTQARGTVDNGLKSFQRPWVLRVLPFGEEPKDKDRGLTVV